MPKIAKATVHRHAPLHFKPTVHVSGCFLLVQDKFLILERHPKKPQGETWGIPSGKVERGELPFDTLIREVEEEIGLRLKPSSVIEGETLYVEHADLNFCYHLFHVKLNKEPKIKLNQEEHTDYKWVTKEQAAKLPLIGGGQAVSDYFFSLKTPLEEAFQQAANVEKGRWYKEYMREQFSYLGVTQPIRKQIQKTLFKKHPIICSKKLKETVLELWDLPEREYAYTAIDLLKFNKHLWTQDYLPFIKKLILKKSWWDTVDSVATLILGPFLLQFPESYSKVANWKNEHNIWLKRALILHQLSYKEKTDQKKLFEICLALSHEQDFFIRKAIGWALRQYRKTNPDEVQKFLDKHQTHFSKLSLDQALRNL